MSSSFIQTTQVASSLPYDNTVSGITATDVQGALDYLTTVTAAGVQNYNIISSTPFTSSANVDTFVTGMTITPMSGTYAVWFNCSETATGSGQQMDCTIYKAGAAISDSKRSVVGSAGAHISILATMTIAQFSGSQTCQVWINPNANSQTVNQRSMLLIRLGP